MTNLTKAELRTIFDSLSRLLPPGSLPRDPGELVRIGEVRERVARMIEEQRQTLERGELVFTWRVPREHAMTMNEYAGKKGWVKQKIRKALDDSLRRELERGIFPKALLHGAQRRRWLRATRFSPRRIDELSVDVIGGKCPTDALVRGGVLADDDHEHLHREARWEKTKPGNTHLLVEVFEMSCEGASVGEPTDVQVEQIRHAPGFMTEVIKNGEVKQR